jgi:hypothetical protein
LEVWHCIRTPLERNLGFFVLTSLAAQAQVPETILGTIDECGDVRFGSLVRTPSVRSCWLRDKTPHCAIFQDLEPSFGVIVPQGSKLSGPFSCHTCPSETARHVSALSPACIKPSPPFLSGPCVLHDERSILCGVACSLLMRYSSLYVKDNL